MSFRHVRILATGLVLSIFLFVSFAHSETPSVVVTEIGAYVQSGEEWVEIVNTTKEPIDLSAWAFFEDGIEHTLTAVQGDAIIAPGSYAIIAQDAETFLQTHPDVLVTVFDSAWIALSESGEEIGLIDDEEHVVEQFTYIAHSGGSLERVDVHATKYDAENWKTHPTVHSAGQQNYWSALDTVPESYVCQVESEEENESEGAVAAANVGEILINEFVSNPANGSEWIELYSVASSARSLEGLALYDGVSKIKSLSGALDSNEYVVIELSSQKLNNGGDSIVLQNEDATIIDDVVYGDWGDAVSANAVAPGKGQALVRFPNGNDTGIYADDFSVSVALSPGGPNVLIAPDADDADNSGAEGSQQDAGQDDAEDSEEDAGGDILGVQISDAIVLSELLPNPVGDDAENEFIELWNTGSEQVDLSFWGLRDASGKTYVFEGEVVPAQGYLAVYRSTTGISLNNAGDTVELLWPDEIVADSVTYGNAAEGMSYAFVDAAWHWTQEITPGEPNVLATTNNDEEDACTCSDVQQASAEILMSEAGAADLLLADVRLASEETLVQTVGVVAAVPGELSEQYMYIVSASSSAVGVQVYLHSKAFPPLVRGDVVRVHGILVEVQGQKRIRLSSAEDITRLGHGFEPVPLDVSASLVGEKTEGGLVRLHGVVTERKANHMYVDDHADEAKVQSTAHAAVSFSALDVEDEVFAVGIVGQTASGYRILPRDQHDLLEIVEAVRDPEYNTSPEVVTITPSSPPQKDIRKEIGIVAFFLGLLSYTYRKQIVLFWHKLRSRV